MRFKTRQLAIAGLLGALVVVLGLTPLGFVPVPTPAGNATTIHIPVILAGVLEGPIVGGVVGLIFGIFSWVRNIVAPTNPVAATLFSDPLVTFVPRILIGVVAYYAFTVLNKRWSRAVLCVLAGVVTFAATMSLATKAQMASAGLILASLVGLAVVIGAFIGQRQQRPTAAYVAAGLAGVVFGFWVFLGVGAAWAIIWRIAAALAAVAAVGGAFVFAFRGASTAAGFAAILGTATNTAGVLGFAVLRGYLPAPAAWTVAIVQGLPECFVAAILVILVERGVRRALRK